MSKNIGQERSTNPEQTEGSLSAGRRDGKKSVVDSLLSSESAGINRRAMLRGIGAAGVAAIGSTGVGVAKRSATGSSAVLESKSVQTLLEELGNPSIDVESAEEVIPKIEGEERPGLMTTTVIPTEVGDVQHVSTEGTSFAYLVYMNEPGKSKADGNKVRKALGAPSDVPLMVLAQERDVTVSRGATPREKALLARETSLDIRRESTHILRTSAINGFRVIVEEPSSGGVSTSSQNEEQKYYDVTVDDPAVAKGNGEISATKNKNLSLTVTTTGQFELEDDASTTEGVVSTSDCPTCNSCTAWCTACLAAIGTGCGPCAYALWSVSTGVGAAVYISCALISCGIVAPISCNNCVSCSPYV